MTDLKQLEKKIEQTERIDLNFLKGIRQSAPDWFRDKLLLSRLLFAKLQFLFDFYCQFHLKGSKTSIMFQLQDLKEVCLELLKENFDNFSKEDVEYLIKSLNGLRKDIEKCGQTTYNVEEFIKVMNSYRPYQNAMNKLREKMLSPLFPTCNVKKFEKDREEVQTILMNFVYHRITEFSYSNVTERQLRDVESRITKKLTDILLENDIVIYNIILDKFEMDKKLDWECMKAYKKLFPGVRIDMNTNAGPLSRINTKYENQFFNRPLDFSLLQKDVKELQNVPQMTSQVLSDHKIAARSIESIYAEWRENLGSFEEKVVDLVARFEQVLKNFPELAQQKDPAILNFVPSLFYPILDEKLAHIKTEAELDQLQSFLSSQIPSYFQNFWSNLFENIDLKIQELRDILKEEQQEQRSHEILRQMQSIIKSFNEQNFSENEILPAKAKANTEILNLKMQLPQGFAENEIEELLKTLGIISREKQETFTFLDEAKVLFQQEKAGESVEYNSVSDIVQKSDNMENLLSLINDEVKTLSLGIVYELANYLLEHADKSIEEIQQQVNEFINLAKFAFITQLQNYVQILKKRQFPEAAKQVIEYIQNLESSDFNQVLITQTLSSEFYEEYLKKLGQVIGALIDKSRFSGVPCDISSDTTVFLEIYRQLERALSFHLPPQTIFRFINAFLIRILLKYMESVVHNYNLAQENLQGELKEKTFTFQQLREAIGKTQLLSQRHYDALKDCFNTDLFSRFLQKMADFGKNQKWELFENPNWRNIANTETEKFLIQWTDLQEREKSKALQKCILVTFGQEKNWISQIEDNIYAARELYRKIRQDNNISQEKLDDVTQKLSVMYAIIENNSRKLRVLQDSEITEELRKINDYKYQITHLFQLQQQRLSAKQHLERALNIRQKFLNAPTATEKPKVSLRIRQLREIVKQIIKEHQLEEDTEMKSILDRFDQCLQSIDQFQFEEFPTNTEIPVVETKSRGTMFRKSRQEIPEEVEIAQEEKEMQVDQEELERFQKAQKDEQEAARVQENIQEIVSRIPKKIQDSKSVIELIQHMTNDVMFIKNLSDNESVEWLQKLWCFTVFKRYWSELQKSPDIMKYSSQIYGVLSPVLQGSLYRDMLHMELIELERELRAQNVQETQQSYDRQSLSIMDLVNQFQPLHNVTAEVLIHNIQTKIIEIIKFTDNAQLVDVQDQAIFQIFEMSWPVLRNVITQPEQIEAIQSIFSQAIKGNQMDQVTRLLTEHAKQIDSFVKLVAKLQFAGTKQELDILYKEIESFQLFQNSFWANYARVRYEEAVNDVISFTAHTEAKWTDLVQTQKLAMKKQKSIQKGADITKSRQGKAVDTDFGALRRLDQLEREEYENRVRDSITHYVEKIRYDDVKNWERDIQTIQSYVVGGNSNENIQQFALLQIQLVCLHYWQKLVKPKLSDKSKVSGDLQQLFNYARVMFENYQMNMEELNAFSKDFSASNKMSEQQDDPYNINLFRQEASGVIEQKSEEKSGFNNSQLVPPPLSIAQQQGQGVSEEKRNPIDPSIANVAKFVEEMEMVNEDPTEEVKLVHKYIAREPKNPSYVRRIMNNALKLGDFYVVKGNFRTADEVDLAVAKTVQNFQMLYPVDHSHERDSFFKMLRKKMESEAQAIKENLAGVEEEQKEEEEQNQVPTNKLDLKWPKPQEEEQSAVQSPPIVVPVVPRGFLSRLLFGQDAATVLAEKQRLIFENKRNLSIIQEEIKKTETRTIPEILGELDNQETLLTRSRVQIQSPGANVNQLKANIKLLEKNVLSIRVKLEEWTRFLANQKKNAQKFEIQIQKLEDSLKEKQAEEEAEEAEEAEEVEEEAEEEEAEEEAEEAEAEAVEAEAEEKDDENGIKAAIPASKGYSLFGESQAAKILRWTSEIDERKVEKKQYDQRIVEEEQKLDKYRRKLHKARQALAETESRLLAENPAQNSAIRKQFLERITFQKNWVQKEQDTVLKKNRDVERLRSRVKILQKEIDERQKQLDKLQGKKSVPSVVPVPQAPRGPPGLLPEEKNCASKYAAMKDTGEEYCTDEKYWMLNQFPPYQNMNRRMKAIYDYVKINFYDHCLWDCSYRRTLRKGNKEENITTKLYVDYSQISETNQSLKAAQIWHIVRWLGVDFWTKTIGLDNLITGSRPNWCHSVERVLQWVLRSGSVYPFATDDMVENMISVLGREGEKHAAVMRLSTSQFLTFQLRKDTDPIRALDWLSWFPNPIRSIREVEYVFRLRLWTLRNLVLVRNISTIMAYLESCGHNQKMNAIYDQPHRIWKFSKRSEDIYLRETIEADFEDLLEGPARLQKAPKEFQDLRVKTILVNAHAGLVGEKYGICMGNGYSRIDFGEIERGGNVDGRGDVNIVKCITDRDWMFDQPLLDGRVIEALLKKYKKAGKPIRFLENLTNIWNFFSILDNSLWCNVGKRGNRNKTMMINWLGMDCINIVGEKLLKDQAFLRSPKQFFAQVRTSEGWKDFKTGIERESYLRFLTLWELLYEPSFDLFMTPVEQKFYALTYPGFLHVRLSGTQPGAFYVMAVQRSDLRLRTWTVDMSNILNFIPPKVNPVSFPMGLLLRLILYTISGGMHVGLLREPKMFDSTACGTAAPEWDNFEALKQDVTRINFAQYIGQEYSERLTNLVRAGIIIQQASLQQFKNNMLWQEYTETEKFQKYRESIFDLLKANAPYKIQENGWKLFVNLFTQFFKKGSPEEKAFLTYTFKDFQREKTKSESQEIQSNIKDLQKQLRNLLVGDNEEEFGGFVGFEFQDISDNLKPLGPHVATLQALLQPRGEHDLMTKMKEFRENEFHGDAYQKEKGFFKKLRENLFGPSKERPMTDLVGKDEPENLKLMRNTNAHSNVLLVKNLKEKLRLNLPLGEQERIRAVQNGLIKLERGTQYAVTTAAAASGVPPPPGERWMEPAGPMSDIGGPVFHKIKDEHWRDFETTNNVSTTDYFQGLSTGMNASNPVGFEESRACEKNGPDYVFPSFEIDHDGRVVARCARSNWMSDQTYPSTTFNNLDPENQALLNEIVAMSKHWCPTLDHQIKLWHWLGVGCLGKASVNALADIALNERRRDEKSIGKSVDQLKYASLEEELEMIKVFRDGTRVQKTGSDKCKKRIIFLSSMITSNILFPYIRNRKNAVLISKYIPDKVVLMLHWSKSGHLVAMRTPSSGATIMEREYDVTDFVNYIQYTPTVVRLRIFQEFFGGICASNYLYYVQVLRTAKKDSCIKTLGEMKRYALRAVLPRVSQIRMDSIWARSQSQVSPTDLAAIKELQTVAFLLESRYLTAKELYLFQEIHKLENVLETTMKATQVAEIASNLYKAGDVDERMLEAQLFENLALCQRPEFVPYIRKKIKDKYPELKVSDIENMDREHLCKLLLNNPNVEEINLPVDITQITRVPVKFQNSETKLLALWDNSKEEQINDWLMKNYGVTVKQMRDYNQNYYQQQPLLETFGKKLEDLQIQKQRKLDDNHGKMMMFRRYLRGNEGSRCGIFKQNNQCKEVIYDDMMSQEIKLCGDDCQDAKVPALKLFELIYKNYCEPTVILVSSDFEFLIESFKSLRDYLAVTKKHPLPALEKQLYNQTPKILEMYKIFQKDCGDSNWRGFPLKELLDTEHFKKIKNRYFNVANKNKHVLEIWREFQADQQQAPNAEAPLIFTLCMLVYLAKVNGVIVYQ